MKIIPLLLFTIFSTLIYFGCKDNAQSPPPVIDENNNGFETYEVAKIFAENCIESGCHSSSEPQHGLDLTSYTKLIKGSLGRDFDESTGGHTHGKILHGEGIYGGEAVIPYHANQSLLYNLIAGNIEDSTLRMPYERSQLSPAQVETIKNWINNGAKDNNGNVPFSSAANKIYASNQGSDQVYVIDTDYKLVSRIIDVNYLPTPDAPHNVAMYGNYLYVTLVSTGRFLKIDMNTNTIISYVDGIEKAGMINLSPDGRTAYVSRSSTSASIYNTIYAVNTESMTLSGTVNLPVTGVPHAIALSHDGSLLYVANMSRDRISIVNAASLDFIEDIVMPAGETHEPMHIYLSPDDRYLYVNCRTSSKMLIYNTETKAVVKQFLIDHHPMQAAITNDGNKIYVVSHHMPVITEITKTGEDWNVTFKYTNNVFQELYGADLSPDGKYLYVTCSNESNLFTPHYDIPGKERPALVCIYDTGTHELVKVMDIGSYATGITARLAY